MVSTTASPAAHATGLPPNVVPWWPGLNSSAAAPNATVAPSGRPPPRPFASVTMSGSTPSCARCSNQCPVRPIPVCTSSRTRRVPVALVISLAAPR
ncbi:hypothetical protein SALBM135S_04445 [Streptomyces alboniger]